MTQMKTCSKQKHHTTYKSISFSGDLPYLFDQMLPLNVTLSEVPNGINAAVE